MTFAQARMLPPNFRDAQAFPEKVATIVLDPPVRLQESRADFLFAYRIFPLRIIAFEAEWMNAGRGMAVGDIILQRAALPPFFAGFRVEFAVRICAIINETSRRGFAYETLVGHAERGVSHFLLEEQAGSLRFTIRTHSAPAHWTSRLAGWWFTRPYQAWCTRQALAHVAAEFAREQLPLTPG